MRRQEMNEPTRQQLLRAFGKTPAAFTAGLNQTLAGLSQEKEDGKVKKKLTFAPVLALVLVGVLTVAAVAVALYPKTAEQFERMYGEEFGDRLRQGDMAELNAGYTLGDVTYTVSDVIYEGGVLYGTVVMEPAAGANIVLFPEDCDIDEPIGGSVGYGIAAPEGAKSYRETAKARGARIVMAKCVPDGYVLDGKLLSGDIGYSTLSTPEGNIVTSFELYGWNGGIQRGAQYTLRMNPHNWEVTPEGEWLREEPNNTWLKAEWDVQVIPQIKGELTADAPAQPVQAEGMIVDLPQDFAGTLPVYAVTARELRVQPEWLNAGEVAKEEQTENATVYTFADEDELCVDRGGYAYYDAYEGTAERVSEDGTRTALPQDELAALASELAMETYYDGVNGSCAFYAKQQEAEALAHMTLDQARQTAEALLAQLNVTQARLTWAKAMDGKNIRALNDARNAQIASGDLLNVQPRDVSGLTQADEGYQLVYQAAVDGAAVSGEYMNLSVYVTKDGVRRMNLRAPFALGGVLETPDKLIGAQEALGAAVAAAKESRIPELAALLEAPERAELIYTVRDQARLVPTWRFTAYDGDARDWPFTVDVSAVDGRVVNGPWE